MSAMLEDVQSEETGAYFGTLVIEKIFNDILRIFANQTVCFAVFEGFAVKVKVNLPAKT